MKLYCIKIKSAWWGNIFDPGQWYDYTLSDQEYEIIVDETSYYEKMRLVASKESRRLAESGVLQEKIKEHIPEYMTLSEIRDSFTIKVRLPVYLVTEMHHGFGNATHTFVQTTREKLMLDYGLDKVKFTTTVRFFR